MLLRLWATGSKICNTMDRENTKGQKEGSRPPEKGPCVPKTKVKRQTYATDIKRGSRCLNGGTSKTSFNEEENMMDNLEKFDCTYWSQHLSQSWRLACFYFLRCQSGRAHNSIPGGFVTRRQQRRKQQVQSSAQQFCARRRKALSMNERRAVVRLWHFLSQREREREGEKVGETGRSCDTSASSCGVHV